MARSRMRSTAPARCGSRAGRGGSAWAGRAPTDGWAAAAGRGRSGERPLPPCGECHRRGRRHGPCRRRRRGARQRTRRSGCERSRGQGCRSGGRRGSRPPPSAARPRRGGPPRRRRPGRTRGGAGRWGRAAWPWGCGGGRRRRGHPVAQHVAGGERLRAELTRSSGQVWRRAWRRAYGGSRGTAMARPVRVGRLVLRSMPGQKPPLGQGRHAPCCPDEVIHRARQIRTGPGPARSPLIRDQSSASRQPPTTTTTRRASPPDSRRSRTPARPRRPASLRLRRSSPAWTSPASALWPHRSSRAV